MLPTGFVRLFDWIIRLGAALGITGRMGYRNGCITEIIRLEVRERAEFSKGQGVNKRSDDP